MKREFGRKLIQEFFPTIELTHVIDTSGAYIPGHGTPTVILIGRRTWPRDKPIRAALGVRGEPKQPKDPVDGLVWKAIQTQIDKPDSDSEWITVADLSRDQLSHHPWSLTGGGASDLLRALDSCARKLNSAIDEIGFGAVTREDSAYMLGSGALRRYKIPNTFQRPIVEGDVARDWRITDPVISIWPYNDHDMAAESDPAILRLLWPFRTILRERVAYGKSQLSRGLEWYEYSMFFSKRYAIPLSIPFAFVATHNHFVLDRGEKVFKQSAPVIKLAEGRSENDHLALLGVLNSSTSCFWLKQVSHNKGSTVDTRGARQTTVAWENFYEFTGTALKAFPIPTKLPVVFGQKLDGLAQGLAAAEPLSICSRSVPTRTRLDDARINYSATKEQMIALQEELDWEVYRLYGLLEEDLTAPKEVVPELKLGERAFEIVLARKMARGEVETEWFRRHGSTPITEIPGDWPEEYRRVVEKRIEIIEQRPRSIGLIERPECKRRWATEPWEKKEKAALRNWLLDRCEARELWFATDDTGSEQPRPMTIGRLADRLRDDADFVSVARLYAGKDAELAAVLAEILDAEHVPYLAALRYKDTGLRKRAQWERTWELQRQEDETGKRLDIPVPPKYASADFLKNSYWSNRGKLDVPKERFISYPGASPDGDGSLLLGWAGWDHREQAHALMTLIDDRASRDGWERERLTPLIAGLAEVLPWVKQWHGEIEPQFGQSWADAYANFLEDQQIRHQLTNDDLISWRPPKASRRRKTAKGPRDEPEPLTLDDV